MLAQVSSIHILNQSSKYSFIQASNTWTGTIKNRVPFCFLLVFVCAAAGSGEAEAAPDRERADGRAARLYVLDAAGEMRAVAALELPGAVP